MPDMDAKVGSLCMSGQLLWQNLAHNTAIMVAMKLLCLGEYDAAYQDSPQPLVGQKATPQECRGFCHSHA